MRWIPIVHTDQHTVGAARYDGDTLLDVHWVGVIDHAVRPESWQGLLVHIVPAHRGTGEGWMVRACQEAVRGMDGTVYALDVKKSAWTPVAKLASQTLVPETTAELAFMVAERLCQQMREVVLFSDMRVPLPHLTACFGVAVLGPDGDEMSLIEAADAALYPASTCRDRGPSASKAAWSSGAVSNHVTSTRG